MLGREGGEKEKNGYRQCDRDVEREGTKLRKQREARNTILTWVTRRMQVKCKIAKHARADMLFDRELSRRKNSFSCIRFTAWG